MARAAISRNFQTRRRIVAAGAVYDLAAVGPLALPFTAPLQLDILNTLNSALGFEGQMPVFLPVNLLFINLFGMLVLVWSAMRLLRYQAEHASADLAVRVCISALLGWYALQGKVNGIVVVFLAVELIFAAANFAALSNIAPSAASETDA